MSLFWWIPKDDILEEDDRHRDKEHIQGSLTLFYVSHHTWKDKAKLPSTEFVQISILTPWVENVYLHLKHSASVLSIIYCLRVG